MAENKNSLMREMLYRVAESAIESAIAGMPNREHAEAIRTNRAYLANQVAYKATEHYRFMELADIMEWKRTRIRR